VQVIAVPALEAPQSASHSKSSAEGKRGSTIASAGVAAMDIDNEGGKDKESKDSDKQSKADDEAPEQYEEQEVEDEADSSAATQKSKKQRKRPSPRGAPHQAFVNAGVIIETDCMNGCPVGDKSEPLWQCAMSHACLLRERILEAEAVSGSGCSNRSQM